MNVATKAFRRSSVRLKSFSCGHSELNLIISDMKEVRSAAKRFADAQETVWKDLSKWACKERNVAVRETLSSLHELNCLWKEVQTDFIDQLNKFKYSFEMILEGETNVDKLREHLAVTQGREVKLMKDLQKARIKRNPAEVRQIEQKLVETKSSIKNAQTEISEKTHENESVKVIRLKEGLLKLSDSYIELSHKSNVIFDGTKNVALTLPDVEQSRGMQDVRCRGLESAKQKVARVKEAVKTYKPRNHIQPGAPQPSQTSFESPPPPYSYPYYPPSNIYPRLPFGRDGDHQPAHQDSAGASWR